MEIELEIGEEYAVGNVIKVEMDGDGESLYFKVVGILPKKGEQYRYQVIPFEE